MVSASCRRQWLEVLLLLPLVAGWGAATPVEGQSIGRVLRDRGLARYFADSLARGTQRILTADGTTLRATATDVAVADVLLPVRVAPAASIEPPATALGDVRVVLPDRAFVGAGAAGSDMLLVPVVVIEGGGLRYAGGSFRGTIRVGIEDSLQSARAVDLPTPIRFFVSGTADSILLPDTVVGHTNLPFPAITIVTSRPDPSISLNVRTTLHSEGVRVEVPLRFDSLSIVANPPRVQGLGLETADLDLRARSGGVGVAVQVVADEGHVTSRDVHLNDDGMASTSIRSYWIGTATVTARGTPFVTSRTTVEFLFPWLFLGAALVGGALGGLLRRMQRKRGGEGVDPGWVSYLASGMLLGLLTAFLYAVGVNVTPVDPTVTTGQAVVLALAAVVGYLGTLPLAGGRGAPGGGASESLP